MAIPESTLQPRTIADARWSCTSCGKCCRNVSVPIEAELVARLRKAQVEAVWPPASAGAWYCAKSEVGEDEVLVLALVDGHCVFLRDDNLCAIHALLGEQFKPTACREFPIRLTRDPEGITAVARPGCIEAYKHWRDGEPVVVHGIRRLRQQPPQRLVEFDRKEVRIDERFQVPLAQWMTTEAAVLRRLEADSGTIDAALVTVRDMIYEGRVPSPVVPSGDRYRIAAASIIESLMFPLDAELRRHADSFSTESREVAGQWLSHLEQAWRDGMRPAPLGAECHAYLGMCLQGELLSKSCHSPHGVAAGLGLFLIGIHIVRAGFSDSTDSVVCERFAPFHANWLRFVSNPALLGLVQSNPKALKNLFLNIQA